jgi:ATP-dependent Clp protease ATP-binding subunit ClpC
VVGQIVGRAVLRQREGHDTDRHVGIHGEAHCIAAHRAAPGYVGYKEGGHLTEAVRRSPHSVVLLDVIEKAHRDVLNVLLQVMKDGVLTDGKGSSICFKNVILVMTSNVGSRQILELVRRQRLECAKNARKKKRRRSEGGEESSSSFEDYVMGRGVNGGGETTIDYISAMSPHELAEEYSARSEIVQDELQKEMKPELLNRIDEIIVFSPLDDDNLRDIARAIVDASIDRAYKERSITLAVSESLIDSIGNDGTMNAAEFGARPMRRASQRLFEDAVSDAIVRRFLQEGDGGVVDMGLGTNGMVGLPTVFIKRQRDGEVLVVDVDDGSGGIGMAVSSRTANIYATSKDELQPDMMLSEMIL